MTDRQPVVKADRPRVDLISVDGVLLDQQAERLAQYHDTDSDTIRDALVRWLEWHAQELLVDSCDYGAANSASFRAQLAAATQRAAERQRHLCCCIHTPGDSTRCTVHQGVTP